MIKCRECGVTFIDGGKKMLKGFVKLSELKDDDMLLVGEDFVISKEDFVKEIEEYEDEEVYTTKEYRAIIDAKDMLESEIDCEANNMYEDWPYNIWDNISEDDIKELQNILDRILSGSESISYIADKRVEIDIYLIRIYKYNK